MKFLVTSTPEYPDQCPFYLPTGYCRVKCEVCNHFPHQAFAGKPKPVCKCLITIDEYLRQGEGADVHA